MSCLVSENKAEQGKCMQNHREAEFSVVGNLFGEVTLF